MKQEFKKLRNVTVICILLVACSPGVFAQVNAGDSREEIKEQVPGIFEGREVFDITLKFDVTEFMRKKSDEDYLDAESQHYTTIRIPQRASPKADGQCTCHLAKLSRFWAGMDIDAQNQPFS